MSEPNPHRARLFAIIRDLKKLSRQFPGKAERLDYATRLAGAVYRELFQPGHMPSQEDFDALARLAGEEANPNQ